MKQKIVGDDYTIINTQGIRYIEKIDGNRFGGGQTEFCLKVTYKGNQLIYYYPTKLERDSQFFKLKAAIVTEY